MSRPGKYGLNGLAERSRTTRKTYVRHRAYICRTAVFAVFEAKSAVAVFLFYLCRVRFMPPPCRLTPGGCFMIASMELRDGNSVKYILIAPFAVHSDGKDVQMVRRSFYLFVTWKKARSLLQNFGLRVLGGIWKSFGVETGMFPSSEAFSWFPRLFRFEFLHALENGCRYLYFCKCKNLPLDARKPRFYRGFSPVHLFHALKM